jgi:hypothetical protein
VTSSTSEIPGLDPATAERAGLTSRQRECLALHLRGASYRYKVQDLGVDTSSPTSSPSPARARLRRKRSMGSTLRQDSSTWHAYASHISA